MVSIGGGKQESKPERVNVWNKGQKALWDPLWKMAKTGLTSEVPAYPGQMYVPKTAEETAYLNSVPQLANELATSRTAYSKPAFDINPETTEQYYQDVIKNPMLKQWEETVEPTIRSAYAGPGYWGGARANAQMEGAEDLATNLASERAKLYYADEQARRQAAEAASQRSAQYGDQSIASQAAIIGEAGAYSRAIDQEKVTADLQRWLAGETVDGQVPTQYNPFLQVVYNLLGLQQYAVGTKSSGFDASLGIMSNYTGEK